MAKHPKSKTGESKHAPPTSGLAFIVGLMLFGMVFCPAGVFLFYNLKMFKTLGVIQLHALTLGCLTGLVIAIIPAFIFMQWTMKKVKY
jgi:hypothetical protein